MNENENDQNEIERRWLKGEDITEILKLRNKIINKKYIRQENKNEIHTEKIYRIQGNLNLIKETKREKLQRIDRMIKRIKTLETRAEIYKNKTTDMEWNQEEYRRLQLIINKKKKQIQLIIKSINN